MQVKERLKEAITLVLEALPYSTPPTDDTTPDESCSQYTLLKLGVDATFSYIQICHDQFEGFIHNSRRQVLANSYK